MIDDLRTRYAAEIIKVAERESSTDLVYGKNDCILFFCNIDVAVGRSDPAAPFRGKYRSERGAAKLLGKRGVVGWMIDATRRMDWKKIDPDKALAGDRGIVQTAIGPAGVIFSGTFWFGKCGVGISATPTRINGQSAILRAWSIQ